ncbi:MAG: hypothetical protein LQ347_001461 [Umbilicaria vellea]|nr:MAG: hypothetical protein LQ347_001461 [Umbilicaria vellea]
MSTTYLTPTESVNIPGNFSAERPPTLNETICGCDCGCAGCACYNAGEGDSIVSWRSDEEDGREFQFEHLANRIHDLRLLDGEPREGYGSTPFGLQKDEPYQAYKIEFPPEFDVDADAEAAVSQGLHDELANYSEHRRLLGESRGLFPTPWLLADILDPRPSTPGADSTMVNPSTGENSLMSSITSSMQLVRSVSPGYFTKHAGAGFRGFPYNFTAVPLELTSPESHAHCCVHGSLCVGSPLGRVAALEPEMEDSDGDMDPRSEQEA